MTTLPNAGIVLPTRGAPGSGLWADAVDAALTIIDAMDHTPGKGARIPTAGININGDLTFSSLYAPTNLHRISFASITALSSNNKSVFVSSADNELYWRSNAGTNVKITSGSALNVAAFTGGIGGDYASTSAAVNFDSSGSRYTFKGASGTNWMRLASGDVRLFETGTAETIFVGLAAPTALAGSYTITMPLAAPGATSLIQMDTGGVLSATNVVPGLITANAGVATTAITASGVITGNAGVATTAITASGVITASAGVAVGANQNVALSGTGRLKHGSRELPVHIAGFMVDGASTFVTFNQVGYITGFGGACTVQAWLPLEVGKRILTYQQFYNVNSTGAAITPNLKRMTIGTGAKNTVAAGSADNTGAAVESQTISSINHTVLSGEGYFLEVSVSAANHQVFGAVITYDDP